MDLFYSDLNFIYFFIQGNSVNALVHVLNVMTYNMTT